MPQEADASQRAAMPAIGGFTDWLGIKVAGWDATGPRLVLDVRPEHINRNGAVHGGVLLSLLDSVCSLAGTRLEDGRIKGRVVAVSITANFIAAVSQGTLHACARTRGGGRRILLVDGEIRDDEGTLIATASGVIRRIEDKGAEEVRA